MEKSVQNTQESVLRKHSGELAQGALSHRSVVSPFPSGIQVQAKLETTEVDDPLEKEADSMADLAMRKIETGTAGALPPPSASPRSSVSAFGGSSVMLPSRMESQLNASLGSGYALPGLLRSQMEGAFGQPFSQVRVHTDASSAEMNQGIGARAFTYGNDIFFNQGQYNPSSADGQKLIAHELTHVAQQSGKVARNVNHSEQQKIVEMFLVQNWHWGQFFYYLQFNHSAVLTELGLSLDDGFFGTNWEKERGIPFLEKVSWAIARDIKKKLSLNNWDSAYVAAIKEFKKHRNRQKRALAPVFDALITITENHRTYKNEAVTRSSYNELNERNKSLPFSGTYFDNRDNIIGNLFFFLKKEYPDSLSYDYTLLLTKTTRSIDEASDISHDSKDFARQIERHLSEFIQRRYDAYYHKKFPDRPVGDFRKAKDRHTLAEFYNALEEELERHISTYGKSARMLLDMVINRHKTVYSNEFYLPPDFISADAWTDLFFSIMIQGGSLLIGGPLVSGIVAKVVLKSPAAKWLINQAVQAAFDAVTGAGEEVLRQKRHGEEFAPKAVLQAAGISVVMGRIVEGGMGTVKGVGEVVARNRAVKQAMAETVGDVGEGVARGAKDAVPTQRALPSQEADPVKLDLGKSELESVPVNRGQSTSLEMQTTPSAPPAHESTVSVPEASATEVSLPTIPDKKVPAREMHDTVTSAPPVQKGPIVYTPSQGSPVVYNYPAVPDPRVHGYPAIPDPRVYGYPAISSTAPEPFVTPVKVKKRRASKSRKAKKVEAHDTHGTVVSQTPAPEKNVSTIETQKTLVSHPAVTEKDLSPIETEPTLVSHPAVTEKDLPPIETEPTLVSQPAVSEAGAPTVVTERTVPAQKSVSKNKVDSVEEIDSEGTRIANLSDYDVKPTKQKTAVIKPQQEKDLAKVGTIMKRIGEGIQYFASVDEVLIKKLCAKHKWTYHPRIIKAVKMLIGGASPFVGYARSNTEGNDEMALVQAFIAAFGGMAGALFSMGAAMLITYLVEIVNKGISYVANPDEAGDHLEDDLQDLAFSQIWNFTPLSGLYSPFVSGPFQEMYHD